jgi:hypothetical protein
MKVHNYPLCITYSVATLGDFIACITPLETHVTDEEMEVLQQSDD